MTLQTTPAESPATSAPRAPSLGRAAATPLLACAVVGLAVWVDPLGLRPATTLRWALTAPVLVAAAALGWRSRPRFGRPLVTVALLLGAALAVATWGALDPTTAWWGHPQRNFGMVAWLVCGCGFVAAASVTPAGRSALGWAATAAAALLGLSAVAEVLGWHLVGDGFLGGRLGGALAQPAFLAAASVLLVPVTAGMAVQSRGVRRGVAALAAGLGAVAIVASQSRGAWIAVPVALLVAWPVRGRLAPERRRLLVALGLLVVVAVAATPVGGRLGEALAGGDGSARSRLDEWTIGAKVVVDHPWTGTGPEGYRIAAPPVLDDGYTQRYGREVLVDRAHSGPLDVAAAAGIPAALLFLAVVALVGRRLWAARRTGSPLVIGLVAGVYGYWAQQLVLFPLAEVDPVAWVLAGAAWAAAPPPPPRRSGRSGGGTVVTASLLAGAVALAVVGWQQVRADRDLATATAHLERGEHGAAVATADAAVARTPHAVDAWYVAATVAAAGPGILDLDAALDRVQQGLERFPLDPALLDLHAGWSAERAVRSGFPEDAERALVANLQRQADDPSNPAHPRWIAVLHERTGAGPQARNAARRALELQPGDPVATGVLARVGAEGRPG